MRLDDKGTPKRILEWKPIGTRIRGRPRKRWIADIEEHMQIMGIRRWRKQYKERAELKRITEKAKTQCVVMPVKRKEKTSQSERDQLMHETNVRYTVLHYAKS